jgi:Domain of unknown function (DUF4276)
MASRKKLVLFVEGPGDAEAVPLLVNRLLADQDPWDYVILDPAPFTVGGLPKLVRDDARDWVRLLKAAAKTRRPLGGVLLVIDGDVERIRGKQFCAQVVAKYLSQKAVEAGAGSLFSVGTVFALREYESWLIAGADSYAGKRLPDGRSGLNPNATAPTGDLESTLRDAKGWLRRNMVSGYKPTTDQKAPTQVVDLNTIRARNLRSFRRVESALAQLVGAMRSGKHVVTPLGK